MAYQKTNPNGQDTMANSSPVVIASDQSAVPVSATDLDVRALTATDVVTVTGGAGQTADVKVTLDSESVAVTGTVTANLSATDNAVLDQIELNQDTQTAVLNTIDADTGGILTAVQIMDDWDNGASDGASVSGDVAHDTADAGEPVKQGFKAYALDGTVPQAVVAEGDRVNGIADLNGRQFVATEHPYFFHVSADYASAQTNTSVKAAPGAGLSLYITDISISNGATAGNITLLDGSGGTVLYEIYPAINGGAVMNLRNPIKLTANTALCITSTTVTTHSLFVAGFIA